MMELKTILLGLAVLNGLVILHEWGHFVAARRSGLAVPEFSVGFGPRLLEVTRGETTYKWRLFPIGGFVLIPALAPEEGDLPQSIRSRLVAVLAGPLANLALVVLMLGPRTAVGSVLLWFRLMGELLMNLVASGSSGADLMGPIGISNAVGEAAAMGWGPLLRFTAFLSLNLGLFNLLPLPGLDGGRLVGLLFEKLNGGRRPTWEPMLQGVGLLLFLGLGLWVTGKELLSAVGWF